jgi:uncharacterized protein (TIGR03437 family)
MTAGTYSGEVALATSSGSPAKVPVSMRVLDPAPAVTAIDPSFVAAPSPDTTFTITGDGFKPGAQLLLTVSTAQMANVDVPVPNLPTVLDGKTLRAVIPGTFLIQPGFIMVRVINPNAGPSSPVKLTVGRPTPEIRQNGISNSASLTGNSVAPGQLITIFGAAMGPTQPITGSIDSQGALSRNAGGVRVLFDGQPGGVLYASDTQINAVVPNSISNRSDTLVTVEYNGNASQGVRLPVVPTAPGIFTTDGGNQALMTRAVTPVAGASSAANRDEVVTLYATGAGLLHDSAGDAMIAKDIEKPVLPVTVRIGGQDAEVLYAGTSPGQLEAVLQLNVRIPAAVAPGDAIPVELTVGGLKSQNGVSIVVK